MSYGISVRRAESQPPFASGELERAAQAHEGLSLGQGVLTWSNAKGVSVELFVEPRELRADRIPSAVAEEALGVLRAVAHDLNAQVVGEEGEDLTHGESASSSPWSALLGGLVAVVAVPLMLLFAVVRLPWVLWKVWRGLK